MAAMALQRIRMLKLAAQKAERKVEDIESLPRGSRSSSMIRYTTLQMFREKAAEARASVTNEIRNYQQQYGQLPRERTESGPTADERMPMLTAREQTLRTSAQQAASFNVRSLRHAIEQNTAQRRNEEVERASARLRALPARRRTIHLERANSPHTASADDRELELLAARRRIIQLERAATAHNAPQDDVDQLERISMQLMQQHIVLEEEFERFALIEAALQSMAVVNEEVIGLEETSQLVTSVKQGFAAILNFDGSSGQEVHRNEGAIASQTSPVSEEENNCCIDFEPIRRGDSVFRLPCLHVHHTDCLLPYLKRKSSPECPVCRTPVPAEDLDNVPVWILE